jgi:hypothetical protein
MYLPILMGYCTCYKQYMLLLGYNVQTTATGKYVVEGENSKEVDSGEYVTFPTYYYKWKRDFPNLKVSRPVEDICPYCYVFANRHRYLVNQGCGRGNDGDNNSNDNKGKQGNDNIGQELGNLNNNDNNCNNGNNIAYLSSRGMTANIDLNPPEAASTEEDEERELMLLEAATHIKMARAQRALYQAKVALAVQDATAKKDHSRRVYTFVVDYGQNMELPVYNKEQPGCTYYFSPLSIFNLGVVNHAHVYDDGCMSERLHCHMYHKGVGKKGANNVASLIIKIL